jgi:protein-L-isoaspartate(D-aspartate) O-methyltransferase
MKEPSEERFAVLRRRMVEKQIRSRGIRDERLLQAMEKVPRHLFVGDAYRIDAYGDTPLPIGQGQTISQPYMVAAMTEILALRGDERVLEVGTGSGYQAAILGRLAREVYTVERIASLTLRARGVLEDLGADNVKVLERDGSLGLAEHAPYDAILVAAGVRRIPEALPAQLADGGRLAVPVGGPDRQVLVLLRREGETFRESRLTPCVFVPLIGEGGWGEDPP